METKNNKIEIKSDSDPSCATFIISNEDHTLGNSVRYMLSRDPEVALAGYTIPHPSEPKMNLRIQTSGQKTAADALDSALENLVSATEHILETYEAQLKLFKQNAPPPAPTPLHTKKK
eukprot:TRINITY_DN2594_c0_g1_i1.p1 TRINITY_DN2594_c0_g1~~TRINITY_DN2594_c0_g1_i1.p1  ORF type:complete len:118 (-),score=29.38 TRINITY_DN2594_c0_g1_i1:191-544(-)